jgi:hypothetical protein
VAKTADWKLATDTRELKQSITYWIDQWNKDPRPYVWHKSADEILTTLAAYTQRISDSGH